MNTASAEEVASTAEELSSQAQEMLDLLSRFKLKGTAGIAQQPVVEAPTAQHSLPVPNQGGWG